MHKKANMEGKMVMGSMGDMHRKANMHSNGAMNSMGATSSRRPTQGMVGMNPTEDTLATSMPITRDEAVPPRITQVRSS